MDRGGADMAISPSFFTQLDVFAGVHRLTRFSGNTIKQAFSDIVCAAVNTLKMFKSLPGRHFLLINQFIINPVSATNAYADGRHAASWL